jgi:hypothetical protein
VKRHRAYVSASERIGPIVRLHLRCPCGESAVSTMLLDERGNLVPAKLSALPCGARLTMGRHTANLESKLP